jgi:hypothetical protein
MEENKIFRSAFLITFVHVFLLYALIVFIDDGLDFNRIFFLVGSIIALFFTYLMIRIYKITIRSEGIRGYDCWGIFHFIEWEMITDVKPIRILGLKYIRALNKETRPLWLPLFLSDMNKFKEEIQKKVPQNNPLYLFFNDQE